MVFVGKDPEMQSSFAVIVHMVASIQSSAQGLILHAIPWMHLPRRQETQGSIRDLNSRNTPARQQSVEQMERDPFMDWPTTASFDGGLPNSRPPAIRHTLAPVSKGVNRPDLGQPQGIHECQRRVENLQGQYPDDKEPSIRQDRRRRQQEPSIRRVRLPGAEEAVSGSASRKIRRKKETVLAATRITVLE
ncbi:MAG: hypothetical protein Q9173_004451 [Seirophora scorigena]